MTDSPAPATAPGGTRRWVAILSLDMVDFTRLSQEIGQESIYGLLQEVLGTARGLVEKQGGVVIDTAGDGLLAVFGAPRAIETASLRACRTADLFQDWIGREAARLQARFGTAPRFRVGIAGGPAMIAHPSEHQVKVVGEPVNAAARLQAMAAPGEVLLDESILRETEGQIRATSLGPQEIKGFEAPVAVHRFDALVAAVSRFDGSTRRSLLDMVSRRGELALALETLDRGAVVAISGVAGIGKSRLTHEIAVSLAPTRPTPIGQCSPGKRARAFAPVLEILCQAAGHSSGTTPEACLADLVQRHPGLLDPAAVARFLAPADRAGQQGDKALDDREFLVDLLAGLSRAEGLLPIIEDLHWVDRATDGLFAALAAAGVPLIVTFRPDYTAPWLSRDGVRRIDLAPLTDAEISTLAEASLGQRLSAATAALISEKSEGVPLIAEELSRALRFGNRLREGADGLELTDSDGALLTGNLEQLVLSRIDALPEDERTALRYAATIGRHFPAPLLDDALGRPARLDRIARVPGLIEPATDDQWRFAHALIRDAVYGSLLGSQRRQTHLAVAEAMERIEGGASPNWSLRAEHFLKAEVPERALPAMVRAAEDLLASYNLEEVSTLIDSALSHLADRPGLLDEEAFRSLAVSGLRAADHMGDFGRLQRIFEQVSPRLQAGGYSPALSLGRTLTSIAKTHLRDYRGALDLAMTNLAQAGEENDDWGAAWAKVALMRIYDETGWEPRETLERLAAEVAPVAEATGDRHMAMSALYLLSAAFRSSGSRLRALSVADEITRFAASHGDRRSRAYAAWARALVYAIEGNPEMAHATVLDARKDAIPGSADDTVARAIECFAQTFLAPADQVRPRILDLIGQTTRLGDINLQHSMRWTLSVLELKAGNLAEGWRQICALIPDAEAAGNLQLIRQCYLMRGEFLMALAGLIDPEAEAPPTRPRHPRNRPGIRDMLTFFRLKPTARRRAARDLGTCLALDPRRHGAHYARCRIGLGILAMSAGRRDEAQDHLTAGLESAEAEELELLATRARRALAPLGPRGGGRHSSASSSSLR